MKEYKLKTFFDDAFDREELYVRIKFTELGGGIITRLNCEWNEDGLYETDIEYYKEVGE